MSLALGTHKVYMEPTDLQLVSVLQKCMDLFYINNLLKLEVNSFITISKISTIE